MEYLPFILYIAAIIFVIYTQIQSNKDLKMVGGVLGGIGMLIILGMMIFDFGSSGIKKGAEYLDDRSAKKKDVQREPKTHQIVMQQKKSTKLA